MPPQGVPITPKGGEQKKTKQNQGANEGRKIVGKKGAHRYKTKKKKPPAKVVN